MIDLYKKINRNLIFLKYLYQIFVVASIFVFVYIALDMYFKSQKSISFAGGKSAERVVERVVNNPRMQLEPNKSDFHYIISDKGVWNVDKDEVDLYNVRADSTLGIITSDSVKVKDENSLLEFRGNPIFTLYLEQENNNNKETN